MTIEIQNLKPMNSGALRATFDVKHDSGLILFRCTVFLKDGHCWAGPPGKQVIGRDGIVAKDANGRARYEATAGFTDRETQQRWGDSVVAAVRAAHPEVLA